MEDSNQCHEFDHFEENFFDAPDHFHSQSHDKSVADESNPSISDDSSIPVSSLESSGCSYSDGVSSCVSSDSFGVPTHNFKLCRDIKENGKNLDYGEVIEEVLDKFDSLGDTNRESEDEKRTTPRADYGVVGEFGDSQLANLFLFIAGFVVRATGFQVNLLLSLLMFPIWGFYNSCMFVVDPFRVIKRSRGILLEKFESSLKDPHSMWKLLLRFGYALFWCSYVCVVLCGLLVFSALASGVVMKVLVENPVEIGEELNFDYTQKSPVAFVPLVSCGGVGCGLNCEEKNLGPRVIPPYQKLQVDLQLTLPESTYNKNLGIFQVRVDLLSANGNVTASKRQPCMLKFKSNLVQTLVTSFKIAPLLTGYISETQTIKVNIRGITLGAEPASCIRVALEQRAEFHPGAGIPELYEASLKLESELPFVKRIIYSWRKTVFLWIAFMVFIVMLMFMLLCCRCLLVPRLRLSV